MRIMGNFLSYPISFAVSVDHFFNRMPKDHDMDRRKMGQIPLVMFLVKKGRKQTAKTFKETIPGLSEEEEELLSRFHNNEVDVAVASRVKEIQNVIGNYQINNSLN